MLPTWLGVLLALAAGAATAGGAGPHLPVPPVPSSALARAAFDADGPRVEARLLVDASVIEPGVPVRVGVLFDLAPGWHMYWRNPGDSGIATRLDWEIDGAEVSAIEWPAPRVFEEPGGPFTTYGYTGQVLLASEVVFEPGGDEEAWIAVQADLAVCATGCIPAQFMLERPVRLGNPGLPARPATRALFARERGRLPVRPEALGAQLEALYSQSAIRPGDVFGLAIAVRSCVEAGDDGCRPFEPGTGAADIAFVPEHSDRVALEIREVRPIPGGDEGFLISFAGRASEIADDGDERLRGVLALQRSGDPEGVLTHLAVDLPLPRAPVGAEITSLPGDWLSPAAADPAPVRLGLWSAVLLALLGGLVLNLMPCVLPVLAIKVFGVTELAQRSRREVRAHGLAYTAGVCLSMLALAGVVLALRATGSSLGWGFQFQEPLFVAAVSAVLVVFALNLFGVFEIGAGAGQLAGLGQSALGTRRSFFEGLLAVVLATPCSAPFLGTAVGFAFASEPPVILAIFLAIGLGLAAPYLVVTLVPAWARWVPRAGPWMLHLRSLLGFALLATVVWLVWVMDRVVGGSAVSALLAFLVAVAFATWLFGVVQATGRRRASRLLALSLGVVLALALTALPVEHAAVETPRGGSELGWRSFDRAAISAELAENRPVFVFFTADWCITCKVNEQLVLEDARVQAELEKLDVAVFRGDWTRRDEAIRAELARYGKAGVPTYVVYTPGKPAEPAVLPELLRADDLIQALRDAASARREI